GALTFLLYVKQTSAALPAYSSSMHMRNVGPTGVKPETDSPPDEVSQRERTEALRWRSVFENSAIGVALTALDGSFVATNTTYQRMLGYSESEFEGLSFVEITHEDYREANRALVNDLLAGKRDQFQIEKQYKRKDGTLIWVRNNVSLVPNTESNSRFMLALSEDITERKQA